jgi:hypothetical protein
MAPATLGSIRAGDVDVPVVDISISAGSSWKLPENPDNAGGYRRVHDGFVSVAGAYPDESGGYRVIRDAFEARMSRDVTIPAGFKPVASVKPDILVAFESENGADGSMNGARRGKTGQFVSKVAALRSKVTGFPSVHDAFHSNDVASRHESAGVM